MTGWAWVPAHMVVRWQARLIERDGGAPGLRDEGLLESALARPRNFLEYGGEQTVSAEALAARYGFALARSHAFIDGNKRIAFAVMASFLKAHGRQLDVAEHAATAMMLDVAAGNVDEEILAIWLSDNTIA